jgi:hypothetical protein
MKIHKHVSRKVIEANPKNSHHGHASVITSKAANGYHFKTGQRK